MKDNLTKAVFTLVLCTSLAGCGGGGGKVTPIPANNDLTTTEGETSTTPAGNPAAVETTQAQNPGGMTATTTGPDPSAVLPASDTPISVLAARNDFAPGSSDTFIRSFDDMAISDTSWVAMAAAIEGRAGVNSHALYRGLHGEFQSIAEQGDVMAGFPQNVIIKEFDDIRITNDSTVYAVVTLDGAVARNAEALVRIEPDGAVVGLIREGGTVSSSVRGETIERITYFITAGNKAFAIVDTDLGNDYVMQVSGDSPFVLARLVRSGIQSNTADLPKIGDCEVQFTGGNRYSLFPAETGAIAFRVSLSLGVSELCPTTAIVKYKDNAYTVLMSVNDTLPLNDGSFISNLDLVGFNDDEVAYIKVNTIDPQGTLHSSIWVADGVNQPSMVALKGELLPPNFDGTAVLNNSAFIGSVLNRLPDRVAIATNNQFSLLSEAGTKEILLSGNARVDQPYESFAMPGANQLGFVTATNTELAPGLTGDTFLTAIEGARMHDAGTVWYVGRGANLAGEASAFSGLWRADPGATPFVVVSFEDQFQVNGQTETLTNIARFQTNKVGDLLIQASFTSAESGWLYKRGSR